jgi:L-threonylcarbamoyladenylate synthase
VIYLYPTDTVFGLGVDATDPAALHALAELKGREEGKYFPIAVSDIVMARQYVDMTPLAERLAEKFWPGKLTLVLTAKNLPPSLLAPDGTVGIRVPAHNSALTLVRSIGRPITTTSANVSGLPPQDTVAKILEQFGDRASEILYDPTWPKSLPPSLPSTVVDARGDVPIVIREGAITELAIKDAVV